MTTMPKKPRTTEGKLASISMKGFQIFFNSVMSDLCDVDRRGEAEGDGDDGGKGSNRQGSNNEGEHPETGRLGSRVPVHPKITFKAPAR